MERWCFFWTAAGRLHLLEKLGLAEHLIHFPQMLAVGTAATRGIAPLRLYDLLSGAHLMDLGSELKRGAGMLDIAWLTPFTLLSCGYDTFTRLWDTRWTEELI